MRLTKLENSGSITISRLVVIYLANAHIAAVSLKRIIPGSKYLIFTVAADEAEMAKLEQDMQSEAYRMDSRIMGSVGNYSNMGSVGNHMGSIGNHMGSIGNRMERGESSSMAQRIASSVRGAAGSPCTVPANTPMNSVNFRLSLLLSSLFRRKSSLVLGA